MSDRPFGPAEFVGLVGSEAWRACIPIGADRQLLRMTDKPFDPPGGARVYPVEVVDQISREQGLDGMVRAVGWDKAGVALTSRWQLPRWVD